ncbi:MAG: hypothetical protein IJ228_06570 [Succinivibrio sp.]|nr:hypothetical protein [Succinivibrio sp.]
MAFDLAAALDNKPTYKLDDQNGWADFVELKVLLQDDHLCTVSDLADIINEQQSPAEPNTFSAEDMALAALVEQDNADPDIPHVLTEQMAEWGADGDLAVGCSVHAELSDSFRSQLDSVFSMLKMRESWCGKVYPFHCERSRLELCKTRGEMPGRLLYKFLLLCSAIRLFGPSSILQRTTALFEQWCERAFLQLIPAQATCVHFGTATDGDPFKGNLYARITKLAQTLNSETTKRLDRDIRDLEKAHGGDHGIDLVGYCRLDEAPPTPVAFAQCTCSWHHWEEKQFEISNSRLKGCIEDLPTCAEYLFVPFMLRKLNQHFLHESELVTCPIDRLRLLNLFRNIELPLAQELSVFLHREFGIR